MDVPILGTLFRSRDYLNQKSDLMIIVTPYIVHPVAAKELSLPDDGYADAPDPFAEGRGVSVGRDAPLAPMLLCSESDSI